MSLESALVARAAATHPAKTTRASWSNGVAPQNCPRPYVVFDLVGGDGRVRSMGDGVNLAVQRVQMTVVANSAATEIDAHEGLLAAFDWLSATVGGTEVVHAHADGGRQTISGESVLPDTRVSSQDFIFQYRE